MTLQCGGGADGQGAYSLVQDAKLAQAGPDLANSLGLSTGDPVLVGLFSPPKGIGSSEPSHQSAVCVFSIADIEARFNENIHMCFNGSLQSRNMEYISGPILDGKCPKAGVRLAMSSYYFIIFFLPGGRKKKSDKKYTIFSFFSFSIFLFLFLRTRVLSLVSRAERLIGGPYNSQTFLRFHFGC